jgi:hypothetical protein
MNRFKTLLKGLARHTRRLKILAEITGIYKNLKMATTIKKDGTYDGRKNDGGRPAKGKPLHPKKTQQQMERALKTKNDPGKKI